ncbi:MAG: putative ABC transporter ATP-binding protein YxlF [Candidatus Heimdallarchaeota archaeon LC_2]|nr:MAG: putative ABC transporter ATP-binding protein YxlF [Candidatus Heimdallarchaeota archaeon LC_2]
MQSGTREANPQLTSRSKLPYLLSCNGLSKKFDKTTAIDGLNFSTQVSRLGLFGPNGSGKSTLLKLMLGILYPSSGTIQLGIDSSKIRFIPDFPNLPKSITVDEWLEKLEKMFGDIPLNIDIQDVTKLDGNLKLNELSAGQSRLIALLPVFYGKPELIILDEPTNFLDMIIREKIIKLLKQQIEISNSKIILASHKMDEIASFCDSVLMIDKGQMVASVSMSLKNRENYLLHVDNMISLREMLDSSDIDYKSMDTITGNATAIQMSWAFWKVIHKFTKSGGTIESLRLINDFEAVLGEF